MRPFVFRASTVDEVSRRPMIRPLSFDTVMSPLMSSSSMRAVVAVDVDGAGHPAHAHRPGSVDRQRPIGGHRDRVVDAAPDRHEQRTRRPQLQHAVDDAARHVGRLPSVAHVGGDARRCRRRSRSPSPIRSSLSMSTALDVGGGERRLLGVLLVGEQADHVVRAPAQCGHGEDPADGDPQRPHRLVTLPVDPSGTSRRAAGRRAALDDWRSEGHGHAGRGTVGVGSSVMTSLLHPLQDGEHTAVVVGRRREVELGEDVADVLLHGLVADHEQPRRSPCSTGPPPSGRGPRARAPSVARADRDGGCGRAAGRRPPGRAPCHRRPPGAPRRGTRRRRRCGPSGGTRRRPCWSRADRSAYRSSTYCDSTRIPTSANSERICRAARNPSSVCVRRHADVDDRQIGLMQSHDPQQLLGVADRRHDVLAGVGQDARQPGAQQHRVLGDHDPHGSSTRIVVGPPSGLIT